MIYEVAKFVKPVQQDWDNCACADPASDIEGAQIFRQARCQSEIGKQIIEEFKQTQIKPLLRPKR